MKDMIVVMSNENKVIVICDEGIINLVLQDTCWIVDYDASYHVTSRKDFFITYTNGDFVKLGWETIKCPRLWEEEMIVSLETTHVVT